MTNPAVTSPTNPAVVTAALDAEVARQLSKGWTLVSRSETQAVLSRTKSFSVLGNVLLTLVTGGIWLVVLAIRLVNRRGKMRTLTVDPWTAKVSVR